MHLKALASILHAIWFFLARRILIFSRFPVQIFCDLFPVSRTLLHLFACLSVCLRSSLPGTGIRVPRVPGYKVLWLRSSRSISGGESICRVLQYTCVCLSVCLFVCLSEALKTFKFTGYLDEALKLFICSSSIGCVAAYSKRENAFESISIHIACYLVFSRPENFDLLPVSSTNIL